MKRKRSGSQKPVFRSIFICKKNELSPFATVFTYFPENIEQQGLGTLFGIIKIDDYSEDSSYVTNLLTSVIKKEYFSKPYRSSEESFEACLRKANLALAELVRHGSMSWAGKIGFAGGSLERNNLHFSCLGEISIFLVRHGQIAQISKDLEAEKDSETHPLKTFSNVSSGKLEIGDKLIFTTKELTEIFSAEELRQNSAHFSPQEFPGFLEISLEANSELAGTIVIDILDNREEETAISSPLLGKETIRKIDSFPAAPEQQFENIGIPLPEKEKIYESQKEIVPVVEEIPKEKPLLKKITDSFSGIWNNLENSARSASGKAASYGQARTISIKNRIPHWNKMALREKAGNAAARLQSMTKKVQVKARKNIENKNKTLFMGLGISLILILVVALIFFSVRHGRSNKNADQNSSESQNSQMSAETSPADINAKSIGSLETVLTLSQSADNLALMNNMLYSSAGKSILQIDPQVKNVSELPANLDAGNFKLIAAMPDLKSVFALTDDNKIISLTPVNKNFQENSISLPDNLQAADMKTYLTYLYIMDSSANQIYRFPRAAGGFGEMQNWLKSGSDLREAKSFAINDDIFAANGINIIPFLQGKPDSSINFQKPQIPLRIDRLYTAPDLNYIYVLDNTNHRIVQYDKQGKIVSQYFNSSIDSVKDIVADEKNKIIYLLSGDNKIEKFSLE